MRRFGPALFLIVLICAMGCARNRNIVVLLPDVHGQVGAIQVRTDQGSVTVEQAYHAVDIAGGQVPQTAQRVDPSDIEHRFEGALAVEASQRFQFKKKTIYCRRDSAELTPESRREFPEIVRHLIAAPPVEIYAVGHADRVGTEKYNYLLSRRRALAVQQELVAVGISSKIIVISFLGESYPQIATPDEMEEPRNRRIELILKYASTE